MNTAGGREGSGRMRNLFGGGSKAGGARERGNERTTRHSSGWKEMLKHLQRSESLRVLDIGPTSSANINFLTGLGHGIYMSNLVEEAAKQEWKGVAADGSEEFQTERFLAANLDFSGRSFDVVLLWDACDYLPEALLAPLLQRLHTVMSDGGTLLAFFHAKATGGVMQASAPDTSFYRYHLTATESVDLQRAGNFALKNLYNNRQIENLLKDFSNFRFFLAKDNLREVIATR